MRAVYSPRHSLHDPEYEVLFGMPRAYPDAPTRAEAIRGALERDPGFVITEPTDHGIEPIDAVHDPGLAHFLASAWQARQGVVPCGQLIPDTILHPALREGMPPLREPDGAEARLGYWTFETCTPLVAGTYAAARAAVDVALTAADLLLAGERAAYGLCRPPGHHAPRRAFGGYCYFNNAAIAANYLARETDETIAILDVDYHHGNGTQQIFFDRGDVLFVSLHADPAFEYPFLLGFASERGWGGGEDCTRNFPLPLGTDWATYGPALEAAGAAIRKYAPDALI